MGIWEMGKNHSKNTLARSKQNQEDNAWKGIFADMRKEGSRQRSCAGRGRFSGSFIEI